MVEVVRCAESVGFGALKRSPQKMKVLLTFFAVLTVTLAAAEPAKEELRLALKENPKNSWALYNLGLMTYLEQDFKTAAKHWKALKELEPSDWQVREKLIQAYWGAGESESANSEIAQLRKARESGKHAELNKKGFFICDQFQVGKIRAFVLEYYELKGERPLAWKFILKSGEKNLAHHFSVGSYPSATEFARAEGSIGPKERRYHLDGYWNNGAHTTYNFYRNKPDYQEVRKEVERIIKGDQKPISSTTPQNPKGEQDGADQPATAPESKPEGNSEPQPESEGRSQ